MEQFYLITASVLLHVIHSLSDVNEVIHKTVTVDNWEVNY
jgi:hypothetical protein